MSWMFGGSPTTRNILHSNELDALQIAYDWEQLGVLVNCYHFVGRVRPEIYFYTYGLLDVLRVTYNRKQICAVVIFALLLGFTGRVRPET